MQIDGRIARHDHRAYHIEANSRSSFVYAPNIESQFDCLEV